jgi:hypothetical protein
MSWIILDWSGGWLECLCKPKLVIVVAVAQCWLAIFVGPGQPRRRPHTFLGIWDYDDDGILESWNQSKTV